MAGKFSYRNGRAVRDYRGTTAREQLEMFGYYRPEYELFIADRILDKLGHSGTLANIPLRDADKARVEVLNSLSRQLAYYIKYPQRFGNLPHNAIAPQLEYLAHRFMRIRKGHGLSPLKLHPMSKAEFGVFVQQVIDDQRLWEYAHWFVGRLERRIREGYWS